MSDIKTIKGIAVASVKTIKGKAIASVKTKKGITFASASNTFSLVQSSGDVFGSVGGTTGNKDTRTANLIVIGIWCLTAAGENISDNQSNSYTKLTSQIDFGMDVVLYYKISPTTSATHTFSTTSHFVGVGVQSWLSTGTPAFDQQSGAHANASGNLQPGSLTPSVNNCIAVTAFGTFNGAAPTTPSGYTSTANNNTSTAEGGGMAYLIQTTATATNPQWNGTGSSQCAVLAIFKP